MRRAKNTKIAAARRNRNMRLFAIDADHAITAFPAVENVPEGQEHFASEKDLAKLAANWPAERLIQIWNGFAGAVPFDDLKPVKKFTNRKTAVARVWKAIQRLDAPAAPQVADVAPKATKARKAAKREKPAPTAREGSKKAKVIELIGRRDGATLKEIQDATSWQPHSVRGFISTLIKKTGLEIRSSKRDDGARTYCIGQ
jgi:hypothetical protein